MKKLLIILVVLVILGAGLFIYWRYFSQSLTVPLTTPQSTEEIAIDNPVVIRKEPYLIYPGNNTSMTVIWQTYETPTISNLKWGKTEKYQDGQAEVIENDPSKDQHIFSYTIGNLKPNQKIYYQVNVDNQEFSNSFFTAPADSSKLLSIYAIGDTRTHPDVYNKVASQLMADVEKQPDQHQTLVFHLGDAVSYGADEKDWDQQYFAQKHEDINDLLSSMPIMMVIGNHDIDTAEENKEKSGKLFRKYFPYNYYNEHFYYSFDYGPIHVTALDQYSPGVKYDKDSQQYQWLKNDLAGSDKEWKIMIFHKPAYSAKGGHDDSKTTKEDLVPLFEEYDVDLVLQGHNHYYARAENNEIPYLTLGGGGAPLHSPKSDTEHVVKALKEYHFARFDIENNNINVFVINIEGQVIDNFAID